MLNMVDGLNFARLHLYPKHMSGVRNKVVDAISRRTCLLNQMSAKVVGFDKFKEEYKSCPDFGEIVVLLKEGVTSEMDGFLLQDGNLFQSCMYSLYFERLSCLRIACWRSCWSFWPRKDHRVCGEFILLAKS